MQFFVHRPLDVLMDRYDTEFGCTPAQYHAAIDKLWKALEVTTPQEPDCFTLAAREIVRLRNRVKELEDHLAEKQ